MNFDIDNRLKLKYSGKAIIVPIYASREKQYYSIDDIQNFSKLRYFLGEVNNHEAYITTSGIDFLKDAFGFEELAKKLYEEEWFSDEFTDTQSIIQWFESWRKEAQNHYKK